MQIALRFCAGAASLLLVAGCVVQYEPPPTPLELQALQSRDYDEDKQVAFGSVMSVFQDLGYTPTSADLATGFITAESVATGNFDWIAVLTDTSSTVQTRATAYIEEVGEAVRVRLSFVEVRSTSSEQGQAGRSDRALLDPALYANAFERIEQAIFVRSSE
ncbi:MAG: hypothetical protein OXS50_05140 [Gammaproteobacteria bacterium]|nr:hypothetical protein [Gammaproteobacteria bacterium]